MYNFKLLPALLFAASALATPAPEVTSLDEMTGPIDIDSVYSLAMELRESIPSSLQPALATAIPSTWVDKLLFNPDYLSTVLHDLRAGTFPYWYSDLPHAIKAEATTVLQDYIDASAIATATATKDSGSAESTSGSHSSTATESSPSQTSSPSDSSSTSRPSASHSSSASDSTIASGSPSASTSASTTASDSASAPTSQSTGAAPAATGGMAISLAGAAGILVAALAL